jgi:hypothetical protein
MRIRFRVQLINFDAETDFYLMLMRIWVIKIMRILANPDSDTDPDPDPQHWI